jgi:hypothetical protein
LGVTGLSLVTLAEGLSCSCLQMEVGAWVISKTSSLTCLIVNTTFLLTSLPGAKPGYLQVASQCRPGFLTGQQLSSRNNWRKLGECWVTFSDLVSEVTSFHLCCLLAYCLLGQSH